jgi:SAM-dependent methyltransferase
VVGIDRSARMLDRARAEPDPTISYQLADLDAVTLDPGRFDLVYSSLALHYVDDLDHLIGRVHRCLVPGGVLVVSVEHPIHTAPTQPGFLTRLDGSVTWPVDSYLREGPRTTDWLAPGVVKHHRTITGYFSTLLRAGFRLTSLVEWGPSPAQVADVPEWAVELERPQFLLLGAVRS